MDNIITELLSKLETALSTTYKKYYYGESLIPVQAYLPIIEVVPVRTSITNRGTGGCKENEFEINIKIKDTLKNYLKSDTNKVIAEYMQTMVKRMEERESNGVFKNATVMGVLKNNLKLDGNANIIDDFVISYDVLPLDESYIIVGTVTINVKLLTPN